MTKGPRHGFQASNMFEAQNAQGWNSFSSQEPCPVPGDYRSKYALVAGLLVTKPKPFSVASPSARGMPRRSSSSFA